MRKLIGAMKMSVDGKIEGPGGTADWVAAWSDDFDLMPQIDACLLGGGMYPGYEGYWPNTRFLRGLGEVAALKEQSGKDIYVIGGARMTASLIEAGLVDELRLIVYPLIAGEGKALFPNAGRCHALEVRKAQPLPDGRLTVTYRLGA